MAKTVGDLFIRVTAKDQQFKKQMRGVRQTIGGVGTSVGRLAGLFGMAFGAGAALSFAIKAASKYSGVFVKQMSKLRVDMLRIEMSVARAFGPVFAAMIKDFRAWVGMTAEGEANMQGIADSTHALYGVIKLALAPFIKLFEILAAIGGSEAVYRTVGKLNPKFRATMQREAIAGQGMTREELDTAQSNAGIRAAAADPYSDDKLTTQLMVDKLAEIAQNTRGPA